ncbi:hypothetical protein [Enterococcus sp. CWB-B31]|uniref:hypothetical protein n=1 Tax=Enterococcus sp. CWB-B31 TaxID=2885159 RepID=UPI001E419DCE|nr:hypothetical protein [Enterococcus sp. CWB-B31]MCB5953904.1 hypothetical protein [Enterococcus sp. CWB-B31]
MKTKKIKAGALVGVLIAAVVSIISVFLPLYSYGSMSYSSYITDSGGEIGRIVIAGVGIAGGLALITILTKKNWLSKITGVISILVALGAAVMNAVIMFGINKLSYAASTGIYVLFAGAALLFITGIMSLSSKKINE